jgi:hypothetical protein
MNENQLAQENFNLPHDVLALPSKGIFYKNKKKSIKVGYLTANDENLLASVSNIGATNLIYNLLRSKIYEPDVKIDELINGDVEAVLIFLRNTAFGPEYNVTLNDPETGKEFEASINLESLNFKTTQYEPNSDGTFDTILPKTNTPVKLKILNYGELRELTKLEEEYPKGMTAPSVTWRLTKQIVELNGSTSKEEIAKFINKMPIMDSKFITNFLNENEPKLDLTQEIFAPSGKKVTVKITFGVEFFRPFF